MAVVDVCGQGGGRLKISKAEGVRSKLGGSVLCGRQARQGKRGRCVKHVLPASISPDVHSRPQIKSQA